MSARSDPIEPGSQHPSHEEPGQVIVGEWLATWTSESSQSYLALCRRHSHGRHLATAHLTCTTLPPASFLLATLWQSDKPLRPEA